MAKYTHEHRRKYDGGYGNGILYRMCEEQPDHKNKEIISGKLWIIGRVYSASIERTKNKRVKKQGNFIRDHAAPIIKKSGIDEWIKDGSDFSKLDEGNLEKSLECHKKVTDLFWDISELEKRSLASKYLHFHAPHAFFIYDSIASKRIKEKVQKLSKKDSANLKTLLAKFHGQKKHDSEYAKFCIRCLCYLKSNRGSRKTPRQLDMELLKYKF